jgi:L-threonylcarbamoyladenylate synthase
MILDGGQTKIGLESTVLDINSGNIKILRPGGTPRETIEDLIGRVQDSGVSQTEDEFCPQISPGLLKNHYAPNSSLLALGTEDIVNQPFEKENAYLFFDEKTREKWTSARNPPKTAVIKVLSETGDLLEAASRLFDTLHELDNCSILRIIAQFAPKSGLGEAINDRLKRASV